MVFICLFLPVYRRAESEPRLKKRHTDLARIWLGVFAGEAGAISRVGVAGRNETVTKLGFGDRT
jgi:hypothetical protein